MFSDTNIVQPNACKITLTVNKLRQLSKGCVMKKKYKSLIKFETEVDEEQFEKFCDWLVWLRKNRLKKLKHNKLTQSNPEAK